MTEDLWMIEAMIQPFKLEPVIMALAQVPGFVGMTVTDCRGFGGARSPAHREPITDAEPTGGGVTDGGGDDVAIDLDDFSAKVKVEIAVAGRARADAVADTIARTAHTSRKGDGRIFVWPIARAIRVRTFETNEKAL